MYSTKNFSEKTQSAFASGKGSLPCSWNSVWHVFAPAGFDEACRLGVAAEDRFVFVMAQDKWENKKAELPGRWKGKGLVASPGGGTFGKVEYQASVYDDAAQRYSATQPRESRKRAFGSMDAKRRDEFLDHLRSEQYRERLRREAKAAAEGRAAHGSGGSSSDGDDLGATAAAASSSTLATAGARVALSPVRDSHERSAASGLLSASMPDLPPMSPVKASAARSTTGLSHTREFAGRTQYDRAHDLRSPRSIYRLAERAKSPSERDIGSYSLTSLEVGDAVTSVPAKSPQARKVSVMREFYRTNGGW